MQKNKRTIEKSKRVFSLKKWNKNQEEMKQVSFSRKQFFRMRFFQENFFRTLKKHKREMITKKKSEKAGETDIFLNTKWLLENEIWTTIFVGKAIFVVNFLRSSENSIVFEKEGLPKKKKRKTMKDLFKKHQITETQKMSSWSDKPSGYSAKKKRVTIYLVRTNTLGKTIRKRCETIKEIEEKQLHKKWWTNESVFFQKKSEKKQIEAIQKKVSKHKRGST